MEYGLDQMLGLLRGVQGRATVITGLSSACKKRGVQTLVLILLHHLNMATHTGLTAAVLSYKTPEALISEFEPPPDRANFADPKKASLFSGASKVDDLTPWVGTELHGLQINQLTNAQRDELALLVAEVGFMVLVSASQLTVSSVESSSSVVRIGPSMNNTN